MITAFGDNPKEKANAVVSEGQTGPEKMLTMCGVIRYEASEVSE